MTTDRPDPCFSRVSKRGLTPMRICQTSTEPGAAKVRSANRHSAAPSLINLIDLIDLIRRLLFPSR